MSTTEELLKAISGFRDASKGDKKREESVRLLGEAEKSLRSTATDGQPDDEALHTKNTEDSSRDAQDGANGDEDHKQDPPLKKAAKKARSVMRDARAKDDDDGR